MSGPRLAVWAALVLAWGGWYMPLAADLLGIPRAEPYSWLSIVEMAVVLPVALAVWVLVPFAAVSGLHRLTGWMMEGADG